MPPRRKTSPSRPKITYPTRRKRAAKATAPAQPALPAIANGASPDISFEKDLWEAAVQLRGNVAPADYKHFVLPLLFLRYLSLKYERRHEQLELALKDPQSEYYTTDPKVAKRVF
jgi:type I restriction-modification system DNA methylase subunit